MDFDEFWDKHGNANGDDTTLAMIRKYGIESVRLIAHNAWLFAQRTASKPTVQADAADYQDAPDYAGTTATGLGVSHRTGQAWEVKNETNL